MKEGARYPSEIIAMCLARHCEARGEEGYGGDHQAEMRYALVRGALEQARAEGRVWTPVIDMLVKRGIWESVRNADTNNNEKIPDPEELADGLIEWIREQTDPKELLRLLEFESWQVHQRLAVHATALDEFLITNVSRITPTALPEIANNPRIDAKGRSRLAFECWAHISNVWEISPLSRVSREWIGRRH